MGKYTDLTGQRFGRLTCIKDAGRDKNNKVLWLCKCDCGNESVVPTSCLRSGNTKSCGCLKKEALIKRNTVHGLSKDNNGRKTRLYGIWVRMKQRCFDPNSSDYDRYGGRGIKVCDEWLSYKSFYDWAINHGYNDTQTIERIDNSGNYEPDNCKWIPLAAQARNKRNNHFISFDGKTKTLAEWSELLGFESSLLRYRIEHWGVKIAFTTPIRRNDNAVTKANSQ